MPTIAHVTTDRTPATAGRLTFATVHAVTAPEPSIIRVPDEAARLFQRLKSTPLTYNSLTVMHWPKPSRHFRSAIVSTRSLR